MKEVVELLEKIIDFQEYVTKRAYELMMARKPNVLEMRKIPDEVDFVDRKTIYVTFSERTNHDCPERITVSISIYDLEKSDEEWSAYVAEIKREIEAEIELSETFKKQSELEKKLKLYQSLKAELNL